MMNYELPQKDIEKIDRVYEYKIKKKKSYKGLTRRVFYNKLEKKKVSTYKFNENLVRFLKKSINFLKSQKAYIYLLPMLIFLFLFTLYPFFDTIFLAFKDGYYKYDGSFAGIGVQNFIDLVNHSDFTNSLINTFAFGFIATPVSLLLALFISTWLMRIKFLQKLYQTCLFLPYLTNALAIGAVFYTIFSKTSSSPGLVNVLIGIVGIPEIDFLSSASSIFWNRVVVILYQIWAGLPFKILIIFSALQGVSKQYYDAAKIDGASRTKTLWKVTVPLISPMLAYLIITGFIGGLKEYTSIVGIFGETLGPTGNQNRLMTLVGFIYAQIKSSSGRLELAAAASVILLLIIMAFTLINSYVSKKKVHY